MIDSRINRGIPEKTLKDNFVIFKGKSVVITGAAGSIGSELSVQIAKLEPKTLVLIDSGETELFYHELRMRELFPSENIIYKIADIKDEIAINGIFKEFQPNFVFHAAAYKHIPVMEKNPRQAVLNNIYGTKVMAKLADKHRVKKFVFISTDKAADPIGVMGASKRIAEILLHKTTKNDTAKLIVRFGNVLGSRGSIVPIIEDQIKNNLPVTITDSKMKRYFMTIPEAVFLVLQAAKIGKHNDTFILDMGRKIKVIELANKLIRAYGKVPGKDIEITFVGKRPGEKIEEELISKHEIAKKTKVKRLLKICQKTEEKLITPAKINALIKYAAENDNDELIKKRIFDLI